jgi:hypothetical protein
VYDLNGGARFVFYRLHALRYACASLWIEQGRNPKENKIVRYISMVYLGRNSWIYEVIPRYVQFACRAARNGRKAGSPSALAIKKRHDSGPLYA